MVIISIALVVLASVFPVLFLYAQNFVGIRFGEIGIFFALYAGVGLLVFFLLWLLTRKQTPSALAAALIMFVTLNLGGVARWLKSIVAFLPYVVVLLIFVIVLVVLGIVLYKNKKQSLLEDVAKVVLVVVAALTLINLAVIVPKLFRKPVDTVSLSGLSELNIDLSSVKTNKRPNIYYFVLDEYSGSNTLLEYYEYDNTPFYDKLRSMGFTVSENSYNYSTDTTTICIDLLNLNYVAKNYKTKEERLSGINREDLPLYELLRSLGYTLYEAETQDMFTLPSRLDTYVVDDHASTQDGETITQLLMRNTLFYPLEEKAASFMDKHTFSASENNLSGITTNPVLNVLDYFEDPKNLIIDRSFTLSWLNCPHTPFQFTSTGGAVAWENRANWEDKTYYLQQLLYMNTRITEVCENITTNDPNAIIILQSDHAARGLPEMSGRDKVNILNAVYFGGKPFERMSEQNGLNTLRSVLSDAFGLDLPSLDEPQVSDIKLIQTDNSPKVPPAFISSSKIEVDSRANTFTFTNTDMSGDKLFSWEVCNTNGELLAEQHLAETPSFVYTYAAEGPVYIIAHETQKDDPSSTAKKLCYIIKSDGNGNAVAHRIDLGDFTSEYIADARIEGNALTLTNTFMPDVNSLLYAWYVMDDNHSAYIKIGYSSDRTTTIYLENYVRQYVTGYVRITTGGGRYDERVMKELLCIEYDGSMYKIMPLS